MSKKKTDPGMTFNELVLGYSPATEKDVACLMVLYRSLIQVQVVNSFYGQEAEELYKKLTGSG